MIQGNKIDRKRKRNRDELEKYQFFLRKLKKEEEGSELHE
jgi:hypothetical protein